MAVSVSQKPEYPIPGGKVRVAFGPDYGNHVRVYLTDCPRESELYERLNNASSSQLYLYEGGADVRWEFIPDAPGVYRFKVSDVSKGATGRGGGWYGSASGYATETIHDTDTTMTVTVGTRLTFPVGYNEHTATLVLYVWDNTCRATNHATHGEVTPAVSDPATERIEIAARVAAVQTTIDALIDKTSTTLIATGGPSAYLDELIPKLNTHVGNVAYHYVADSANAVGLDYLTSGQPSIFQDAVSFVAKAIDRHITNDNNSGTGIGSETGPAYHEDGSSNSKVMWEDRCLMLSAGSQAEAVKLLGEVRRSWNAHVARGSGEGHKSANTAAQVTAFTTGSVLAVHEALATELAKVSPTTPDAINPAANRLAAELGAEKA